MEEQEKRARSDGWLQGDWYTHGLRENVTSSSLLNKIQAPRIGGGHKVLTPPKSCLKQIAAGKISFLQCSLPGIWTIHQGSPHAQEYLVNTKGTPCFLFLLWYCVLFYCLFDWLIHWFLFFGFGFVCFKRNNMMLGLERLWSNNFSKGQKL